jgi:O-antigen/teichoic acid export membrane protein
MWQLEKILVMDYFNRQDLKKDLRGKSVRGGIIRAIANGTATILRIGSTIVLARLLTPSEFGIFAMVFVITDFARLFIELGLGTATVQREEITHEEVSTLFWINLGTGAALMIALICLSKGVAWFYGEPELLHICVVLSTVFLFSGLCVQHRALLERQMRFYYLGAINVLSTILSICVAISMALHEFGVWALVWREVIFAILYAVGLWLLCGWIPGRPTFSKNNRSILGFGAWVSGFDLIQYASRSLDKVLIGRFAGPISLGLYSKASQLSITMIEHIRMTFVGIGLSPLSAIQSEHERYCRYFSKILSILSFVYMPLIAFIAIRSEVVILLLLGESWGSAAPMLRLLAIGGFAIPILGTCQLGMISCGDSKRYFLWGMISSCCTITAFSVGIRWGAIGMAYACALERNVLLLLALQYCLKNTPINILLVIKAIMLPLASSISAGLVLIALLPRISNTNTIADVAYSILIFTSVYLGLWFFIPTGRRKLAEFWSYPAAFFGRA